MLISNVFLLMTSSTKSCNIMSIHIRDIYTMFLTNDITVASKLSHFSSLNCWISFLVDETKCVAFKMSCDWFYKAWQDLSVIPIVSLKKYKMKTNSNEIRCKYTFNPYILHLFHFGLYIFISLLLVPKSINVFHFGPYRYSLNRNCWCGKRSPLLAH